MPAAARMARALSSVPDFGAPTERLLPLRSASVLMPRILARHDLDVVRIDRRDAAQLVERRLEAGVLVALPGERQASPSVKAISPLPCCSRFRFSTEALVACTDGRLPGILSV